MCRGSTIDANLSSQESSSRALRRLRYLYRFNTALCVFMVFWILILPGSWMLGRWNWFTDFLKENLDDEFIVPRSTLLKYEGHSAAQLTHTLPGALWAGLIPFQLHKGFRKNHASLHRRLGYVFFSCSFVMAVGIGIIVKRGLVFEHFFPDLPPSPFSPEIGVITMTIYWVSTAILALRAAIQRKFLVHERWVIRHVAAGIWIALQRLLLFLVFLPLNPPPVPREVQRSTFGNSAYIAMAISIALSEDNIALLEKAKQAGSAVKKDA